MAKGVNKAIILGHLGKDPEVKYTQSGACITNISVATTDTWTDKASGQKQESTEWHRVVFFNKLAEIAGEYLRKGSQVYIEGSIKTRKWQDQQGQDRYTTEIVANEMQMIGGQGGQGGQNSPQSQGGCQGGQGYQQPQQGYQQQPRQAPQQSYQPQAHRPHQHSNQAPNRSHPAPNVSPHLDSFDDDIPFS